MHRKEDVVTIKNLEVFAHHGVHPEENVLGQKFLVDAELYLSTKKAGKTDALTDSVSYGDAARLIKQEMTAHNYQLLERAAEQLAEKILLQFPLLTHVRIEIKKPWAPVLMHLDYTSVRIERGWHKVYIGAGSNLGDRRGYIEDAFAGLTGHPAIRDLRAAEIIETEPYGYLEQGSFLNTVFEGETLLEPEELLSVLQEQEQKAGRKREIHWGPRTLDLDLLLYDDLVTSEPSLVLPHPEIEKRMFVLTPLCELNPYGIHPLLGRRYTDLKNALTQKMKKRKETGELV